MITFQELIFRKLYRAEKFPNHCLQNILIMIQRQFKQSLLWRDEYKSVLSALLFNST